MKSNNLGLAVAIPVEKGNATSKKGLEKVKKFEAKAAAVAVEEAPRSPSRKRAGGNAKNVSKVYTPPNEGGVKEYLTQMEWPYGLQHSLLKSCERYPIRYFIVDDSGSMLINDGHRIVGDRSDVSKQKMIKCTRWSELTGCLQFHAELSHRAQAPTEFRFLNMAEPIVVGSVDDPDGQGLSMFLKLLEEESPGGQTPLCEQIRQVISQINAIEDDLRRCGQKACVIVATDGEPTDGDLVEAMRPLQHLPVWLVVRICCDTPSIIEYWNGIDSELEVEMDVLDDISGEAFEIRAVNPWLQYSEPLHRLREFGSAMKELDLVDESLLSSEQMAIVCSALLCDESQPKLPLPEIDIALFLADVKRLTAARPLVFDPITKLASPVVNLSKLRTSYDPSPSRACIIT